ncbi:MAG TPA: hypothetical protein VJ599_06315, partial [Nitrososphaeraceae archaeon]|nr:hypothetical protein [Nitrososphaeraceae archaeon]
MSRYETCKWVPNKIRKAILQIAASLDCLFRGLETIINALNTTCFAKTFYLTEIILVVQIDFHLKNGFFN